MKIGKDKSRLEKKCLVNTQAGDAMSVSSAETSTLRKTKSRGQKEIFEQAPMNRRSGDVGEKFQLNTSCAEVHPAMTFRGFAT